MLFRGIEQKGYYTLPAGSPYLIYADHVDTQNDTLLGVVLTKVDGNEIKEINSKGNPNAWYKSEWVEYAGLVAIAAVLVLFFLTSKSMSEMWQ